jgi:hypothetical protein
MDGGDAWAPEAWNPGERAGSFDACLDRAFVRRGVAPFGDRTKPLDEVDAGREARALTRDDEASECVVGC